MQIVRNNEVHVRPADEEARDTVQQPQPLFIRLQLLVLVHPVIETRCRREHADHLPPQAQFVGLLPRRPPRRTGNAGGRPAPRRQGAAGPHGIGERAQERGLPMPGSPTTATIPPWPAAADS